MYMHTYVYIIYNYEKVLTMLPSLTRIHTLNRPLWQALKPPHGINFHVKAFHPV